MAGFTGFALAMCMYDGSGRRVRQSYAAVGKACYGAAGERAVVVVQMLNLVSVGVVYLVLLGETMSSVGLPILRPGETQSPDGAWAWLPLADRRLWTLTATAAVFPTVHLGGYKKLSFMSALGLICLTTIMVLGIWQGAEKIAENGRTPGGSTGGGGGGSGGGTTVVTMPTTGLQYPAAYSIFVFAFSAHGIFPDLEVPSSSLYPLYSLLYTCIAIYTPMYTRYTCIYTIYTPHIHLTRL